MTVVRKSDSRRGAIDYEAASLAWLSDSGPLAAPVVPVLERGATWLKEPRLDHIHPSRGDAENFGRALAYTHAAGASHMGCPPDGFTGPGWIGQAPLSLLSAPHDQTWGSFYALERILPYVDQTFTSSEQHLIDSLCERLADGIFDHDQPALVNACHHGQHTSFPHGEGNSPIGEQASVGKDRVKLPAARTHGDLWSGNLIWTSAGGVLIDPAAQGGHAETDLAALALFGCPHLETILAAYNEASALANNWRERIGLHQLHLLAVHCQLFGRSYVSPMMDIVRRWA